MRKEAMFSQNYILILERLVSIGQRKVSIKIKNKVVKQNDETKINKNKKLHTNENCQHMILKTIRKENFSYRVKISKRQPILLQLVTLPVKA